MTPDERLYPTRPFVAASTAVFRDGRVLLASRTRPPLASLYSLPGGLVEPGETLAEAALRELDEEVGVRAELVGFLRPVEVIERDEERRVRHHFVIFPHVARWVSGDGLAGAEAGDVRWIGLNEIAELRTTPGLAATLSAAFAMMERA